MKMILPVAYALKLNHESWLFLTLPVYNVWGNKLLVVAVLLQVLFKDINCITSIIDNTIVE